MRRFGCVDHTALTIRISEHVFPTKLVLEPYLVDGEVDPGVLHDEGNPLLVLPPVLLVELRRLRVGRAVGVGLVQQGLDGRQDGRDVVGGAPPVLQDVQADAAVRVHVRVEHAADEAHRRRLVRVLLRELCTEKERKGHWRVRETPGAGSVFVLYLW